MRNWWKFQAPPGASWVIKYLCKVKNDLTQMDMANWSMNHVYSIKKVYTDMLERKREVIWALGVWNRMNLPRNKFILWLGIQGRLKTKDMLFLHGISPDNTCCLCGNAGETHAHLFFECEFSKQILSANLEWIGVPCRQITLQQWVAWARRRYKGTKVRRHVMYIVIAAVAYQIWMAHNEAYWQHKVRRINHVINNTKCIVKHRIHFCVSEKWSDRDCVWVDSL